MTTCTSCGANLEAEKIKAEFDCPSCGEIRIGRCERCKKMSRPYVCSGCSFEGP